MALKWVHENIEAFGGDPDNVTIFGESAGAASVTLLPLVKGSHQYIKRLIAESGTIALTRSTEEAVACTDEIMNTLGCTTIAELQKVDEEKLVEASGALGLRVAPERDGKYLPTDLFEAYANGAVKDVDIILGCNKDEANWLVHFSGVDGFKMWAADRKAWKISKLPDEEKKLIESFCADVKGEDYESDRYLYDQLWFKAPLIRLAEEQTKGGGKAYIYYFTPESSLPYMKCGHETELASVFNHPEETFFTGRAFDETFGKTMRKMWFQFAKSGDPSLSADISPDGKPYEWPLYDLEEKKVMVLDEFNIHPEKESEIGIVDWERIYSLTRYYWL
jgi:para-nitrobenzyl esterase